MLAKLDFAFAALREEPVHLRIRCAGKKEKLVKIALPRQLCLARRKARILRKLPKRKRPQRHYRHASLLRKGFQSISCRGQRLSRRNARKPPKSQRGSFSGTRTGRIRPQMKIVLRQVDAASVFRKERMRVGQLSARLVELQARAARQPKRWYFFVVERGG